MTIKAYGTSILMLLEWVEAVPERLEELFYQTKCSTMLRKDDWLLAASYTSNKDAYQRLDALRKIYPSAPIYLDDYHHTTSRPKWLIFDEYSYRHTSDHESSLLVPVDYSVYRRFLKPIELQTLCTLFQNHHCLVLVRGAEYIEGSRNALIDLQTPHGIFSMIWHTGKNTESVEIVTSTTCDSFQDWLVLPQTTSFVNHILDTLDSLLD